MRRRFFRGLAVSLAVAVAVGLLGAQPAAAQEGAPPEEGTPAVEDAPAEEDARPQEGSPPEEEPGAEEPWSDESEGEPGVGAEEIEQIEETVEVAAVSPLDVAAAAEKAAAARSEEFERVGYRFCVDPTFEPEVHRGDLTYCSIVDESSLEVCEAAKRLCERQSPKLTLPEWFAWAVLGAAVLAALIALAAALRDRRWRNAGPELVLPEADADAELPDLQKLPEAPAQAILRRVRDAAESGRWQEAALLLQVALLRYLDDNGLVTFHPSRTNGDYLRAIRRHRPLASLYRAVSRQTERIRFGDGRVDEAELMRRIEEADRALAAPPPATSPAAPDPGGPAAAPSSAAVLVALVSSLALDGCTDAGRPYYDRSPGGLAALVALLRAAGIESDISYAKLEDIPEDVGVTVVRSRSFGFGASNVQKLDPLLDRGVDVLVIDDGDAAHELFDLTVVRAATTTPPAAALVLHSEVGCAIDTAKLRLAIGAAEVRVPREVHLRSDASTVKTRLSDNEVALAPLFSYAPGSPTGGPGAASPACAPPACTFTDPAVAWAGRRVDADGMQTGGCLIVLASVAPFANASLTREPNARLAVGLFASLLAEGEKVVLLEAKSSGAGGPSSSISRSVSEARLLPFILQAGLWVIALFVFLGAAFGRLRDPPRVTHKAFVEHVEAVGRHYAKAGPAGLAHASRSLARLVVMRHRQDVRGPHEAGWDGVARHLAEKHGLPEKDVREAIDLGLSSPTDTGGRPGEPAANETILWTLSTLLSGRGRPSGPRRGRRR